ncbi:hypothetical protein GYMLUDRAFT_41417 [Collybiopsis luxurians FD-317 M1]|uniref:Uncharacterized protein n=1 Tax=Collybiopsis luxurians FD-317 M1 TaxID=944289 RepID=A0A0D0CJU8_9AGAR|nr:hypothetical protein GYMLUDRAFT_41417 [Collybiopsis luxurians FD-317 M1]
MHNAKAKAKGISSTSFLDLKAEVSNYEEQSKLDQAAGKSGYIVGGVQRPGKKPTVWSRPNKGVKDRAARDLLEEIVSKPTLDSAKAQLERKTKIYNKLQKGKSAGLTDKQYDALLVDFDSKGINSWESDSDDVDESLTVPVPPPDDENDPIIDYMDEFGRTRSARRSEVPRHLMPKSEDEDESTKDDDDEGVILNPQNHFPTYQPSDERVSKIEKEYSEENRPLNVHYDATGENREQGAARYNLSSNEEARRLERADLDARRAETKAQREASGAVDVRVGEIEGMQTPSSSAVSLERSRAMEKRKRDLEERRKALEAKRKKPRIAEGPQSEASTDSAISKIDSTPVFSQPPPLPAKGKTKPPTSEADDFLADLEKEMLSKKGR